MANITAQKLSIRNDAKGESVRDSFTSALLAIAADPTLPKVSTSDANKVLIVDSQGKWAALDPSTSGE